MSYQNPTGCGDSYEVIQRAFLQDDQLPFANVLTEKQIDQAFAKEGAAFGQKDGDVYTPALTLWGFLSQVIQAGAERSCAAAVERIRSLCLAIGIAAPSPDTGAYCRARAKLPTNAIKHLTYQVADALEKEVPHKNLWYGHPVKRVTSCWETLTSVRSL